MKLERVALFALLPVLFAMTAIGCNTKPGLTDDEGSESDGLSRPYARGTTVNLRVTDASPDTTWQIVSDNPAIFAVEGVALDNGALTAVGRAVADGETTVRVVDEDGKTVVTETAVVRAANQARIYTHASFRISGRTDTALAAAQLSAATVLVNGKASFAIAYFSDSDRLFGRGILETTPNPALTVENKTTMGVTTNEFLFVTPTVAGAHTLELRQGDRILASLPIDAVDASALTALTLEEEQGADAGNGAEIWLYAKVLDNQQRDVLGVYVDWLLNGAPQADKNGKPAAKGDLYRYNRDKNKTMTVTAKVGALEVSKDVHASAGFVYDTTYLGCSAMGDPATSLATLLFVGAAALVARRRKHA